jgi:hypothetical protein
MTPLQEKLNLYTQTAKDLNFHLYCASECREGGFDSKEQDKMVLFYATHLRNILDEIEKIIPKEEE